MPETNPQMTVVPGVIHPYPQPKPHPALFQAPSGGDGVRVGVLDPRPAPRRGTPSLLAAGHTDLVTALIHAMAPDATVIPQGVADAGGLITASSVVRAMTALADADVHVIYLSVSCTTPDGEPPLELRSAVEALSRRVLLVAAAGDQNVKTWPAALDGVVAVGARQDDDTLSDFSPRQPWVTCTAPGSHTISLTATAAPVEGIQQEFTGDATWSGTAFAAATACGAIAAKTVPDQVTAQQALDGLLAVKDEVVWKYVPGDDGQRA